MPKVSQKTLGKLCKALYAALVSALGSASTVLTGATTFSHITDGQWTNTALFALIAGGGVYGLSGWAGPKPNGDASA